MQMEPHANGAPWRASRRGPALSLVPSRPGDAEPALVHEAAQDGRVPLWPLQHLPPAPPRASARGSPCLHRCTLSAWRSASAQCRTRVRSRPMRPLATSCARPIASLARLPQMVPPFVPLSEGLVSSDRVDGYWLAVVSSPPPSARHASRPHAPPACSQPFPTHPLPPPLSPSPPLVFWQFFCLLTVDILSHWKVRLLP